MVTTAIDWVKVKDNVREKLKEDKALMAEIEGKILAQLLPERYEASHAETEANQ